MANAKHTSGPWVFDEVRTDCGRAFRIGSGEMLTAGKGCCIIYDDYPGNPDNERKANARLIAAAPDLLEALEKALNFIANTESEHDVTLSCGEAARAAIAKARGEG